MKKLLLLLLLLIINHNNTLSQSYLDNYDYVPLITFGGGCDYNDLIWYDYDSIKLMGSDIFIAMNPWADKFNALRNADIKAIPSQTSSANNWPNYISKYTDAIYSIWEPENLESQEWGIKLSIDNDKVIVENDAVRTISQVGPGYIIWGPNYLHRLNYAIDVAEISYDIKFKLKVEPTINPSRLLNGNLESICRLEVTTNDRVLKQIDITADDFNSYSNWIDVVITYSKTNNATIESGLPAEITNFYISPERNNIEVFKDIEFKVYYYGTEGDYLNLYVDKITCSDGRGKDLVTQPIISQFIIAQANNTGTFSKFTNDPIHFNNTVVGWYAADEPSFIDNWACVKKVTDLLNSSANGRKLVITVAGSWNGLVYDTSSVYRIDELMKRAEPDEVIMDNYIYNYPLDEGDANYKEYNINNMLLNHLDRLNNYDIQFVLNLQTGLWNANEGLLEVIPSSAQFNNTAYLGLLYGAKGLGISKYFYNYQIEDNTTGLFRVVDPYTSSHQPLWSTIKDELSPVLKGRFGRTIKNLNQKYQVCNFPADMGTIISDSFWLKG